MRGCTLEELYVHLLGRISSRRRPIEINGGDLLWIVGHPTQCPYRFSFRALRQGFVTLVIYDEKFRRVLPEREGVSIGFTPDQVEQVLEIFGTAKLFEQQMQIDDEIFAQAMREGP